MHFSPKHYMHLNVKICKVCLVEKVKSIPVKIHMVFPWLHREPHPPKAIYNGKFLLLNVFRFFLTFVALQLQLPFRQCTPGMFMFLSFIRYTTLISFPSSSCLIDLTLPTYHISRLDFFSSVEFALFSLKEGLEGWSYVC